MRVTLLTLEGDDAAAREVERQLGRGPASSDLGSALERVRDSEGTHLILSREYVAGQGGLRGSDTLRTGDEMRFSIFDRGEREPGISAKFLITAEIFVAVGAYFAERGFRGVWISSVRGVGRPSLADFLDETRRRFFFALIEGAADRFMPCAELPEETGGTGAEPRGA